MFNEKKTEYSTKQGKEVPVWQTDKYTESKAKAIDVISSGKYSLTEADFWILMNETKSGKMAYSGLIISHNGCLKINDSLPQDLRFAPECVTINENGYGGSLVCFYNCPQQGLFEAGEVSSKNCKIDYPYAMAIKRLFDRVVLKNSKLAYSGIYGEDESDEFQRRYDEPVPEPAAIEKVTYVCADCKHPIEDYTASNGVTLTAEEIAEHSMAEHGAYLCSTCLKRRNKTNANK